MQSRDVIVYCVLCIVCVTIIVLNRHKNPKSLQNHQRWWGRGFGFWLVLLIVVFYGFVGAVSLGRFDRVY
jgi:choline-glycine betaine transporter